MSDDIKTPLTFSQRMGIVPVRTALQVDSMDEALRNSLWNVLTTALWTPLKANMSVSNIRAPGRIVTRLWTDHLKRPLDKMPLGPTALVEQFREYFFDCQWYAVYDLLEFIANDEEIRWISFFAPCNVILKREQSGYRFVDTRLVRLTSDEEIESLETALAYGDEYKAASKHLKRALELLADRNSPDYRNSIKESISAVEAVCQVITEDPKATLGQAVKKLEDSGVKLHPAFEGALQKMYGYTNDAEGIRHALLDEPTLDADDARFMLVSCSAFVNYLKAKSSKSGS